MKPVTLPIAASSRSVLPAYFGALIFAALRALGLGDRVLGRAAARISPSAVIAFRLISASARLYSFGNTLTNLRARLGPVVEDLARAQAPGPLVVVLDQRLQQHLVGLLAVPDRRARATVSCSADGSDAAERRPSPCCSATRTGRPRRRRRRCRRSCRRRSCARSRRARRRCRRSCTRSRGRRCPRRPRSRPTGAPRSARRRRRGRTPRRWSRRRARCCRR